MVGQEFYAAAHVCSLLQPHRNQAYGGGAYRGPYGLSHGRKALQKSPLQEGRKGRRRKGHAPKVQLDLSDVVDVHSAAEQLLSQGVICHHHVPGQVMDTANLDAPVANLHGSQAQASSPALGQAEAPVLPSRHAYTLPAHPGLVLVPSALNATEQLALTRAALVLYPEPPSITNHDLQLGPLPGVWAAAQQGLVLRHPPAGQAAHQEPGVSSDVCGDGSKDDSQTDHNGDSQGGGCLNANPVDHKNRLSSPPSFEECWQAGPQDAPQNQSRRMSAAALLRRLRHAVLGPHFDWTRRVYDLEEQHRSLPAALRCLGVHWGSVASSLHHATAPASAPESAPGQYSPDAALIHYYFAGDTLMGHRDDVERDLDQPIITVSLGCDAIFLMGGATKDIPPTPLLIRSGDVLVLSGAARSCYHGVPRIMTDSLPSCVNQLADSQEWAPFVAHLKQCRINVSIRSVT